MTIAEKINSIFATIEDIAKDEPAVAQILFEHTGLGVKVIQTLAQTKQIPNTTEDKLNLVASIFGFNMEELLEEVISGRSEENINKEADQETLNFITAQEDVDDYERFLKENNVKENLIALAQEI